MAHSLDVEVYLASDWKNHVNRIEVFRKTLEVHHPATPSTPVITDFTDTDRIPIVVPRGDVKKLLSVTDAELDELIRAEKLVAFGAAAEHVTKGSLISLLGLR